VPIVQSSDSPAGALLARGPAGLARRRRSAKPLAPRLLRLASTVLARLAGDGLDSAGLTLASARRHLA